eukprot:3063256-Prorocentrum_lima.AAC.1
MTEQSLALIHTRKALIESHSPQEQITAINRQLKTLRRQEKKTQMAQMVNEDMDPRDRWLGLRHMKRDYAPTPY